MPDALVLQESGSGQTGIVSGASLVTQIARIVGGESEAPIRTQALDALNRVRIELNHHDWRFMKRTDDPITLVDGTATYSLETTFRKPAYAGLVDSSGDRKFDLAYCDDEVAIHTQIDMTTTGQPSVYLLRNDFEDGLVTVFPVPDSSTATNYRLSVEYFARIEGIADSTDPLELPEEATNVLVIGGQAYILREREKNSPSTVIAWQDYQRTKMLMLTDDRRIADEQPRFRLGRRQTAPFGTMFIRV